jgi:hypothetical protein
LINVETVTRSETVSNGAGNYTLPVLPESSILVNNDRV